MEHFVARDLLQGRVQVFLVGAGGNGAQMANCLARLDIAMKALGHPAGLHVTAFDADTVSEANVGRQVYGPADVGQNKALLTINRINAFYGSDWCALPFKFDRAAFDRMNSQPHLVISCVDSAASRRDIHKALFAIGRSPLYWLDLGNTDSSSQVVLGRTCPHRLSTRDEWERLPCVTELFPQLLDASREETNAPSCSVAISLAAQGLFVNDVTVRWAAQLLYELFSEGRLRQHGVVVNLKAKRTGPIDVDPLVWHRFGIRRRRPRARA